ncbi:MAG: carboxypeptidase-like regulatory domain-containing protein, partial [Bacteroidales bacterium]
MKKYLLYLLFISLGVNLFAQTVISGRILDERKQPLPFATVCVNKNNQLVYGGTSDLDGRFEISNIAKGEYTVLFSNLGFESKEKHIVCGAINKMLDLGTIILNESAFSINEVHVTGQKRTVSSALDKKSFSTSELISNSNGSILEAIKQLPGVTVSQEGKVMLRGSDKVLVLVDGKQSSLTGFDNQKGLDFIPASQIESIEIINNPSAKFDASGTAGIVNIKFKEQKSKGLNGEAGFSFGLGNLSKRKGDLPTGMSSYTLN